MDNLIWEKTLIGSVIADPKAMQEAEILIPSDFTGANQIIWSEICALNSRGGLDARSVVAALTTSNDIDRILSDVGSIENYMAEVLPMKGNSIKEYVDHVLDGAIKKTVRRNSALIAAEAENDTRTSDELLDFAEKKILSIRRNRADGGMTMADLFGVFIPRMEGYLSGALKPAWTPEITGLRDIINFAEETDYITVAARPGGGKSSLLRFEAYSMAKKGQGVLLFNLENDAMDYARHFMALHTGIDSTRIKDPKRLSPEELDRIKGAATELSRLPMTLMNIAAPSAAQLAQLARRHIAEHPTKMVMLDYVQLVRNGYENKVQDVSETTGIMRGLAMQMHVPVMSAAQVSRKIEARGTDAEPQLSDLRDSGTIEQDSTIVMFVREFWNTSEAPMAHIFPENFDTGRRLLPRPKAVPISLYVLKNRNGEIGISSPIKWIKSLDKFQTLEPGTRVT